MGDEASPLSLNAFGYAGANPAMRLDPTGLASTSTSNDGGACVDLECGEHYKDYNQSTVDAAAGSWSTWYLEEQSAAYRQAHSPNLDYVVVNASVPGVSAQITISSDRIVYAGIGPALTSFGASVAGGFIQGGGDLHSAPRVGSFIEGWTRTESGGIVVGGGWTHSSQGREAFEFGFFTPGASAASNFAVPLFQLPR